MELQLLGIIWEFFLGGGGGYLGGFARTCKS